MRLEHRLIIKDMLDAGKSISDIANAVGVRYHTIYYELQRKSHDGIYDPYYAQSLYDKNSKNKGKDYILSDPYLANYIAKLLLEKNLSPEKIATLLAKDNKGFSNIPSEKTIYNAIDKGLIPGVNKNSFLTRQSTVFSNGHICIPKWVLKKLDISDGDILLLEVTEDNKIIYKKQTPKMEK